MSEAGEAYEKILTADLQRVIDFLKFAEAKNAALLALSSAWILAAVNLECNAHGLPGFFSIAVPIALVLALCAALLAAWSFVPQLKLPSFLGGKRPGPHPKNLLYFGDIASMNVKEFEQELRKRYVSESAAFRAEYLHDLITQISVNSCITVRKMKLFSWGVRLVIITGLSLLIPALIMVSEAAKGAM